MTTYCITIRGRLSDRFATVFERMTLVPERDRTHLVGELDDQSALFGVLDRIRELGIELERLEEVRR